MTFNNTMNMMNASNVSNEIKWPSLYYSYVFSLHDIVKGTALSIITLIVIIANIICLFALRKTQINPATRVLMYSLNAADLNIGIFVALPVAVSAYINDWIFGYPGCFLNVLLGGPPYHASNLTLLAMAVERYIAVAKPLQYRVIFRKTRATVAVGAIWIFSYSYQVVVMGVSRWNVHFHRVSDQCWSITPTTGFIFRLPLIILPFVPVITFSIIYMRIFCIIREQSARRQEMTGQTTVKRDNGGGSMARDLKLAKTFMIITLAFLLSTLPLIAVLLTESTLVREFPEWVHLLVGLLSFSNSWLNTSIYFFRNEDYRRSVWELFKRKSSTTVNTSIKTFSSVSHPETNFNR